jgi:hypothetical protein
VEDSKEKNIEPFSSERTLLFIGLLGKKSVLKVSSLTMQGSKEFQPQSVSTISNSKSTMSNNKRARIVSEASLDPITGALRGRLNENYVQHPELPTAKQPCCSLCRFVTKNKNVRTYTSVFPCDLCKVHLCITCLKPFHTVSSVKNLKSQLLSCLKDKAT